MNDSPNYLTKLFIFGLFKPELIPLTAPPSSLLSCPCFLREQVLISILLCLALQVAAQALELIQIGVAAIAAALARLQAEAGSQAQALPLPVPSTDC